LVYSYVINIHLLWENGAGIRISWPEATKSAIQNDEEGMIKDPFSMTFNCSLGDCEVAYTIYGEGNAGTIPRYCIDVIGVSETTTRRQFQVVTRVHCRPVVETALV
jgi:hypothetical protein